MDDSGNDVKRLRQDLILELTEPAAREELHGVFVGVLAEFDDSGAPSVVVPRAGIYAPVGARSTVALQEAHRGRDVVIVFEGGNVAAPIVLGLLHGGVDLILARAEASSPLIEALVDDDRVVMEASRQIELRCGKASITLSRDGKIRIRGTNLLSRASGQHRIKGGSVHIN
jgi:hypothetical protein